MISFILFLGFIGVLAVLLEVEISETRKARRIMNKSVSQRTTPCDLKPTKSERITFPDDIEEVIDLRPAWDCYHYARETDRYSITTNNVKFIERGETREPFEETGYISFTLESTIRCSPDFFIYGQEVCYFKKAGVLYLKEYRGYEAIFTQVPMGLEEFVAEASRPKYEEYGWKKFHVVEGKIHEDTGETQ